MIRDMEDRDLARLEAIHETSGLDYLFPNLADPLFVVKKVFDDQGVKQGMAIKLQAEVYLWIDHAKGTPSERWEEFQRMVVEVKNSAYKNGLDTLICVLPPELEKQFSKRLRQIGMTRDRDWPKFSFDLTNYTPA
jgi:hypothetical protein